MGNRYGFSSPENIGELAIVDTFTKLIFGEEGCYSGTELRIIQALRITDDNVAVDSHREMGVYLRALGVDEMIKLVSRVQRQMASGHSRPPRQRNSGAGFHQLPGV